MLANEPVRGSIPPPWFFALPGIERIQAICDGLLPLPPLWRLLDIRPAHIGPGSGTWTMPATAWHAVAVGYVDITPLVEAALAGAAMSTVPPGKSVRVLTITVNYFRPPFPQRGTILARARVQDWGRHFLYVEAEMEDSRGRHVAHATSRMVMFDVKPPPPPAPEELHPQEEPKFATPDPIRRPPPTRLLPANAWDEQSGLEVVRAIAQGQYDQPLESLLGVQVTAVDLGRVKAKLTPGEQLAGIDRAMGSGAVATLTNLVSWICGFTLMRKGETFVGFEQGARLGRAVALDARPLFATTEVSDRLDDLLIASTRIVDADGQLVALGTGVASSMPSTLRRKRAATAAKRVLATLLFTDIVGSTAHAERLGDAKWRALLDEHHRILREEIRRCEGVEIDTAGDGFFVRFDSPASALECAAAIRDGVQRLGLDVRCGVHTGECEVQGRNLAGMAVHVAARIQAAAAPGEVWTSSTVKDLAMGSARNFEDRGEHTLKGVPGEWRLFALLG